MANKAAYCKYTDKFLFILLCCVFLVLTSCHNKQDNTSAKTEEGEAKEGGVEKVQNNETLPKFSFEKEKHDFGEIIQGEIVSIGFKFTNTGTADLQISSVRATCGCTASSYPANPVKPGKSEVIKLTFDSKGRRGRQVKTAIVQANTLPDKVYLQIKATVIENEKP